jgi:hypothetical protein
MKLTSHLFARSVFSLFLLGVLGLATTSAATIMVRNTSDSGPGSLRQAIRDSNTNLEDDTIVFDPAVFNTPQTIILETGELATATERTEGTSRSLVIVGPGADLLTISGNRQSRVLSTDTRSRITISGITFTDGNGTGAEWNRSGGALLIQGGDSGFNEPNFTMIKCVVRNSSTGDDGGYGGGMKIVASAKIIDSAIINNSSPYAGGGISMNSAGAIHIVNSTISHNTAGGVAAGVYLGNSNFFYLTNSTIAFNKTTRPGSYAAGVFVENYQYSVAMFYPRNSIVADNYSDVTFGRDIYGRTISYGNNLVGESTFISPDNVTDFLNAESNLDPVLTTRYGPIPVHPLNGNSIAIDNGSNCVVTEVANGGCGDPLVASDQRGVLRPQDGRGDGEPNVDIGAFEVTREEIANTPTSPPILQVSSDSGTDSYDGITNYPTLTFDLSGLISGATIELVRNGLTVASGTVQGSQLSVTDPDTTINGRHTYAARQRIGDVVSLLGPSTVITVDNVAPIPTVAQAQVQIDPIRLQPINFAVTFNELVSGLDVADVSLAESTAGISNATVAVSGSNPSFNVAVSNISSDGSVVIGIRPAAVTDLAGNPSASPVNTDNSVTLDTTGPRVTLNRASTQADPTRSGVINFTVVFEEPVTGFTGSDVSLQGSTANLNFAGRTVSGSGTTYNVEISGVIGDSQTVVVSIPAASATDAAGNANTNSTSTDNLVVVDNVSPRVTINQAVGQADPTNVEPIAFTVVFSEPVTGFGSDDVLLTAGFPTSQIVKAVSGAGTTYRVELSNIPPANSRMLYVNVATGAASDSLGNLSAVATTGDYTVVIDNVSPSVSVNQALSQNDPTSVQPVNFTAVFSEPVTGFTSTDISLAGSTVDTSAANIAITGTGPVYNVAVSGVGANGIVKVSVNSAAAADTVGNQSLASISTDNSITLKIASVSGRVTTPTGQAIRNALVTMTDGQGVKRTATTSSFGVYLFENVRINETWTIGVVSKRYRFTPRVVVINESLMNFDFAGLE